MTTHRVIARLDIKGPNLVKGIHLEGLRVLGRPSEFARQYYSDGADELLYMDVVASLYERNSLRNLIADTAREIFIPLTVGGGLRTVDDIRTVLRAGADKVSLNTAAIKNPLIIAQASRAFGSSTIVVAIEAIRQPNGLYFAYTDNGRNFTGVEVVGWARKVESLGAGEILLTSVDQEGTGSGYDIELTRSVARAVSIPVIAHGGAGRAGHVRDVIIEGRADAVAIASLFHYHALKSMTGRTQSGEEGNTEFLRSGRSMRGFEVSGIENLKSVLRSDGVACRAPIALSEGTDGA